MKWSDVGNIVASAAPVVAGLLTGPAGVAVTVGGLIAKALGSDTDPASVAQILQADPTAFERVKKFEMDHELELVKLHLSAETSQLTEINATIRAEAASLDPYVRRWRPTFGYSVALAWTMQMVGLTIILGWAVISSPATASGIIEAMARVISSLMVLWTVALSVLGINVKKRSDDKQISAGKTPEPGVLGTLLHKLTGGGN